MQERDPFIAEIEVLSLKFGKLDAAVVEFCKKLYELKDRKLMQVYKTYLSTYDRDDFINSIKLLYKRKSQAWL